MSQSFSTSQFFEAMKDAKVVVALRIWERNQTVSLRELTKSLLEVSGTHPRLRLPVGHLFRFIKN